MHKLIDQKIMTCDRMAMTSDNNLFSDIPVELKEELFETILK